MVPINFDQPKERLGAMELVMLGARVLSVCMNYEELLADGELVRGRMGVTTLLRGVGILLSIDFHVLVNLLPHATKSWRSCVSTIDISWLSLAQNLGWAYLSLCMSIKLVVESALLDGMLLPTAGLLMGYGVGVSIPILFGMRWMHYAGRDHINFEDRCM
jgi:hypothetical protein